MAGLTLAFIEVLLTVITGNTLWDACGTIAVGALLMILEVKAMVTGESAAPQVRAAIKAQIEAHPGVAGVRNLISMQSGEQVMIVVQNVMQPQPSDVALVGYHQPDRGANSVALALGVLVFL